MSSKNKYLFVIIYFALFSSKYLMFLVIFMHQEKTVLNTTVFHGLPVHFNVSYIGMKGFDPSDLALSR